MSSNNRVYSLILLVGALSIGGCAAEKKQEPAPRTVKTESREGAPATRVPDPHRQIVGNAPKDAEQSAPVAVGSSPNEAESNKPALPTKKFSMRKVLTLPSNEKGPELPETPFPPDDSPSATASEPSGGSAPLPESEVSDLNAKIVPVYFGTNRRPRSPPPQQDQPEEFFTSKLGPLQFGVCRVSVPRNREIGSLKTASKENQNPAEVFVLRQLEVEKNGLKWVSDIAETISTVPTNERDALVFVHGYNVSFADAVYRTAQLKEDLHFAGPALSFSWPSRATLGGYRDDESVSKKSVNDFEQFLRLVLRFSKANKVHVIAHSMGNRVMAPALANIAAEPEIDGSPVDQIILAAPDIDARVFRDEIAPLFVKAGNRRTLYASKNDSALRASFLLHKLAARLGDGVEHARDLAMEAVDAQLTDTSLLAHSYYGDEPLVIEDIRAVLNGKSPGDRNLVRVVGNSWSFKLANSSNWVWILAGVAFAAGLVLGIGMARVSARAAK